MIMNKRRIEARVWKDSKGALGNRSIVNDALHSTLCDPYSGSKSYQNMSETQVASPASPQVVMQG